MTQYDKYLELGKSFEASCDFENAALYYIKADDELKKVIKAKFKYAPPDPSPNTKLGRLYLKVSTQKAIEFWELEKKKSEYKKYESYKRAVDIELAKALEKQAKGYVYKPRNKK